MPKQDKRVEKYETKKGIRYRFKTYVGTDINGKKVWATRSGFTSYTEAKYELDKLKLEGVDSFVKQKQIKVNTYLPNGSIPIKLLSKSLPLIKHMKCTRYISNLSMEMHTLIRLLQHPFKGLLMLSLKSWLNIERLSEY